jgi:radical SAM superfamily enzyme YgiQ (UPF0313 family)
MNKKILMIYPESPLTFWSLKHTLKIVNKKALMPPLGLLTIAAMLPSDYEVKLIDMNVVELTDDDILWADMVFISAMIIQKESFRDVVIRCNRLNRPIAAGGPYPTSSFRTIEGVDHFLLGEGESVIHKFLNDFENGFPDKIYISESKPDIKTTPMPRFDLINIKDYGSMPLQFSRGCPFNCEFCDIIEMFGRKPRLKSVTQFIDELDAVYNTGFRGLIFIVDDNFIGHRGEVIKLLKAINDWQSERFFPFTFFTEASINLAADDELLELMTACAFTMVFIGIETPDVTTLVSANKQQNVKHDLYESVITIQKKGIEVIAGFILGFDTDTEDIFDRQINFIQKAGIPMAMIGIMLALPGTQLYRRLEKEDRILYETSGNNTNIFDMNFIPVMDKEQIIDGYKRILSTLYSPENYFKRSLTLISRIPDKAYKKRSLKSNDIKAFIKSFIRIFFSRYGISYIFFIIRALRLNPGNFPLAVILSINGYHFFEITRVTINSVKTASSVVNYSKKRAAKNYELQDSNVKI